MSDFPQGLQDFNEYLNTKVSVPTSVTVDDTGKVVETTSTTYTIREIICSLLAGNGIKLPNLQICLKINLERLLAETPAGAAFDDFRAAVQEAIDAMDEFIAHTDIENVINRMNAAIAEFAAVANMINFCGTPIQPRKIPNVLADIFGSFTGAAQTLLDDLGKLYESEIGGCISSDGKFKLDLFTSGLLKDIADDFANIATWPSNVIDDFSNRMKKFSSDIKNLMEFENNFGGGSVSNRGGSKFAPTNRVHKKVGMGVDYANMSVKDAQRLASGLKVCYDQLEGYEVDGAGNNIFHYILEPELIDKLNQDSDPISPVETRVPTYDYCGRIIGYTDIPLQLDPGNVSSGDAAELSTQPGSTGLAEGGVQIHSSPTSTTNLDSTTSGTTSSTSGSTTLSGLTDASIVLPTTDQVLAYNGTAWVNTTPTSIDLTDLTVNTATASGNGSLVYNNSTGVFTFTPADVSGFLGGYATTSSVTTVQNNVTTVANDLASTNAKLNIIVAQVNTYHNSAITRLNNTKTSLQALLGLDPNLDSAINDLITDINGMIAEAQAAIITQTF
jgi:hypothetical protein